MPLGSPSREGGGTCAYIARRESGSNRVAVGPWADVGEPEARSSSVTDMMWRAVTTKATTVVHSQPQGGLPVGRPLVVNAPGGVVHALSDDGTTVCGFVGSVRYITDAWPVARGACPECELATRDETESPTGR